MPEVYAGVPQMPVAGATLRLHLRILTRPNGRDTQYFEVGAARHLARRLDRGRGASCGNGFRPGPLGTLRLKKDFSEAHDVSGSFRTR